MRHRKDSTKLGRSSAHLKATTSALVCGLIVEKRIRTTLAKAKLARRTAEKMVTLGRSGSLHDRRRAVSILRSESAVAKLFSDVAPLFSDRNGGYTRIVKLGRRSSDSSEMAILEWVGITAPDKKRKTTKAEKEEEKVPPPATGPSQQREQASSRPGQDEEEGRKAAVEEEVVRGHGTPILSQGPGKIATGRYGSREGADVMPDGEEGEGPRCCEQGPGADPPSAGQGQEVDPQPEGRLEVVGLGGLDSEGHENPCKDGPGDIRPRG